MSNVECQASETVNSSQNSKLKDAAWLKTIDKRRWLVDLTRPMLIAKEQED